MDWQVTPADGLSGTIAVPGSKSHTVRAVIAGLLSRGTSEIYAPLYSADTRSALQAVRMLGAEVVETPEMWEITGRGTSFTCPEKAVDLGNSGTTMRIITAVAALGSRDVSFDGDNSLRTRIMQGLLDALAALGVECRSRNGFAPLTVRGPLRGGRTAVDGTTSQFLTALLMALPLAENDSAVELEFLNEADYVKITLDWLARCGITVYASEDMLRYEIPGRQEYQPFSRVIPADFSTAAFPLGAALAAGKEVRIANLDFNDLQGDKKVFEYARAMNGDISQDNGEVVVKKSRLTGGVFDLNATPDALPLMAVLGCLADGETRLINVPQARLKECDRIACMSTQLRKMGADITELPDGLVIRGGRKLHGAHTESCGDHRIAMALTVAALGADGKVVIADGSACEVTYPAFAADFRRLGAVIEELKDQNE
ncbi:MAG: 3-phosphoshikimate 1-carboxyvinyltransferase [Lentisphaeria bacterium]|nr:3-phosphoshikimate 1-carboxyvinyltransferase [Lentisphaeria bacterium]